MSGRDLQKILIFAVALARGPDNRGSGYRLSRSALTYKQLPSEVGLAYAYLEICCCARISRATSVLTSSYSIDALQIAVSKTVMAFNPNQHADRLLFLGGLADRPVNECLKETRASTEHCEVAVMFSMAAQCW